MSQDRSRLLTLVACAIVCRAAATPASIRGVDPKIASRYSVQHGAFACLGGGKTVPADRVNDNYCDCLDGSDEPGEALPRPITVPSCPVREAEERPFADQPHADALSFCRRHVSVP